MAISAADMNQIRVDVLGTSVDQATTWTTVPPGSANTLAGAERVITRALNLINANVGNALAGTNSFADRFSTVIGDETAADQSAFESIGSNLIQAVAALAAGGGVAPGAGRFVHEQEMPADTWEIEHELGQRVVAVQLVDDTGVMMLADVDYVSDDELTVTFALPRAGIAVVRR